MPKRLIHTGLPYEVVSMTFPPQGGQPPMEGKILRFIDGDTMLDFPLTKQDWDEIVRQGNEGDDPKRTVQIVREMPTALRREPPSAS